MNSLTARKAFPLGQIVITPEAGDLLNPEDITLAIDRHSGGDWGDCEYDDARENELCLEEGLRLHSVYHDRNQREFWIITEEDRSVTTILLPENY